MYKMRANAEYIYAILTIIAAILSISSYIYPKENPLHDRLNIISGIFWILGSVVILTFSFF